MDNEVLALIALVTAVLVLVFFLGRYVVSLFKRPVKGPLLSEDEKKFYGFLCQLSADRAIVLCKIRLCQLPRFKAKPSKWTTNYRKLNAQQFDFIICRSGDFKPLAIVEFEDGTKPARLAESVAALCIASDVSVHRLSSVSVAELATVEASLFPEHSPRFTRLDSGLQLPVTLRDTSPPETLN